MFEIRNIIQNYDFVSENIVDAQHFTNKIELIQNSKVVSCVFFDLS